MMEREFFCFKCGRYKPAATAVCSPASTRMECKQCWDHARANAARSRTETEQARVVRLERNRHYREVTLGGFR